MNTPATPTDPLVQQLLKIEKLIATGAYPAAAEALQAAEQVSPGDPRIYMLLSRLAEHNRNPKAAVEAMRRATKALPLWHIPAIELAALLDRQNQFREAVEQAQRAVALAPADLQLLTYAIDIANRAQHFPLALQWLRSATALAPNRALFKQLIAQNLRLQGQNAQAIDAYTALLEVNPTDATALFGRAQAAWADGKQTLAQQDCDALVKLEPSNEEYRFWQALVHGQTPSTQPAVVVRGVHDAFADRYDMHVVRSLKYRLPLQVAQRIKELHPDLTLNVLDLGCGTGLMGLHLGRINGALIGVDVSEQMINQAIRHNVYDRFHTVNLLDALQATPDANYHVITACDVFIYVGDLSQAIPNAYRVLQPGGHLIFSCESAADDEADLVLRPTMRYAHKASHIEALCRAAGFDRVSIEVTELRLENNEPVHGFIVVAHKP